MQRYLAPSVAACRAKCRGLRVLLRAATWRLELFGRAGIAMRAPQLSCNPPWVRRSCTAPPAFARGLADVYAEGRTEHAGAMLGLPPWASPRGQSWHGALRTCLISQHQLHAVNC